MAFKISNNKPKDICVAYRCLNKRKTKDRFCSKHRHRYKKENNQIAHVFDKLRSNAIRRDKKFTLTLTQFKAFCADTGYLELRGRGRSDMSIDRIDPLKGYEEGNIRMITNFENAFKGSTYDVQVINGNDDAEVPF